MAVREDGRVLVVSAPRVLIHGSLLPGSVIIDGDRIVEVTLQPPEDAEHVRLTDGILTAGMVDLQVNGFAGVDFLGASPERWGKAAEAIARTGVTSFLATFVSHPLEDTSSALARAQTGRESGSGARVLGVHLEGPFLSQAQAGAHDAALLLDPTSANVDLLLAAATEHDVVRLTTLAPELPGAIEAITRITNAGIVVSLGHSDATAAQARAGVDAGATVVTHLFNAQSALHQREPGLTGLALDDPRLTLGVIADLQHVAPELLRLAFKAAGPRIALVTDAIDATQLPTGHGELGGSAVTVDADGLPRLRNGTIAGSTLTMDQAVRNVVSLGVDPAQALTGATRVPADVVDREDLGRLIPGALADLVWWSDSLEVRRVWVGGREV